jgi:hypothetical protein
MGEAMVTFFRQPLRRFAAQRRVAVTASRGWDEAQMPDAHDEIEDDREDRDEIDETSEIIDSGDDAEEDDRAREDRRVSVG